MCAPKHVAPVDVHNDEQLAHARGRRKLAHGRARRRKRERERTGQKHARCVEEQSGARVRAPLAIRESVRSAQRFAVAAATKRRNFAGGGEAGERALAGATVCAHDDIARGHRGIHDKPVDVYATRAQRGAKLLAGLVGADRAHKGGPDAHPRRRHRRVSVRAARTCRRIHCRPRISLIDLQKEIKQHLACRNDVYSGVVSRAQLN
mmetsp:Transcript_11149/g.29951  ORF Transcript_11149/g.29951 Transcript_11149/m.29951 type:complete len:206 (+) Transcript_11149:903-1520(+)